MKLISKVSLVFSLAAALAFGQAAKKTSKLLRSPVTGANTGIESPAETGSTMAVPPMTPTINPEYRIGPGDVLEIDIWKEPDASVSSTTVRPDGKISFPFVKELQVAGLTPLALETFLSEKLQESQYFHNPQITVLVKEINSQKIYVVGEVKKEGAIRLVAPMTVLQALAEAGGITDYAKRSKIQIFRIDNQKQRVFNFDYNAVVRGQHLEQNFQVLTGDTIVVPR